jgi:hypothetical protein
MNLKLLVDGLGCDAEFLQQVAHLTLQRVIMPINGRRVTLLSGDTLRPLSSSTKGE